MRKQYCTTDQQVSKGCWYALHVDHDSVTVKKPLTNDLLLYFFLLEYSMLPSIRTVPVSGHLKQKLNF